MASFLLATVGQDRALDIVHDVAEYTGGWTPELRLTALLVLKPQCLVARGTERSA
jgi:hypothetical protein